MSHSSDGRGLATGNGFLSGTGPRPNLRPGGHAVRIRTSTSASASVIPLRIMRIEVTFRREAHMHIAAS